MNCRVLKKNKCIITQGYSTSHKAVDIVGNGHTLDNIVAHSDGIISKIQDGFGNKKNSTGSVAYGNYIKIDHNNGYSTLYAHLEKGLKHKKGDKIQKGEIIGKMSDSGNAFGKHLHFEVFKNNSKINPTEYLNKDLPNMIEINNQNANNNLKYKINDSVSINGVYISSTSTNLLKPLITKGTITKIIPEARNPYLLNNGDIGWVNDDCIIKDSNKYLSNKKYTGSSIVDALKKINVDSSFDNRKIIANKNGINNYQGTSEQNIKLLNMLKQGKLKY